MTNLTDRLIEQEAKALLHQLAARDRALIGPPVDLDAAADAMGLRVEGWIGSEVTRRSAGAGRVVARLIEHERVIQVSDRCAEARRRFSIAHELGHWCLHRKGSPTARTAAGERTRALLRSACAPARQGRRREVEANRFAAALLLPATVLQDHACRYASIDARAIAQLAALFGVSWKAMQIRIYELDRRGTWDALPRINYQSIADGGRGARRSRHPRDLLRLAVREVNDQGYRMVAVDVRRSESPAGVHQRIAKGNKWVVELAGPPNGGKDTQIAILVRCLRSAGYRVVSVDDGFTVCPFVGEPRGDKFHWAMSHTLMELIAHLREECVDIILLNRGPFDMIALARYWRTKGALTPEEESATVGYLSAVWALLVDTVLLLDVSAETSILREHAQGEAIAQMLFRRYHARDIPAQKIVSQESLQELRCSYDHALVACGQDFGAVVRVPECPVEETADRIMRALHEKGCVGTDSERGSGRGNSPVQSSIPWE